MPDSTGVKVEIYRIHESNWKEELEDRRDMIRRVKARIRDMVMTTPREMESSCGSKIDWIDWAGVEIESEMDSLIE